MTGTFTFDFSQPWRPRSQFLQTPLPNPARTQSRARAQQPAAAQTGQTAPPAEPSGFPADWPLVRTAIVTTLRNFPDAFDAVVRVLSEMCPEPLYT